jgi:hypothetical protein
MSWLKTASLGTLQSQRGILSRLLGGVRTRSARA